MNLLFLSKTMLFRGTTEDEVEAMLQCMESYTKVFTKEETVYRAGEVAEYIGLVLSGGVNIENTDAWGYRSILSYVGEGQIFAETYACIPGQPLMVSVTAVERTTVLFLNTANLLRICPNSCVYHNRIIKNLLQISAQKNLSLSQKILHTSSKSIRGRLLSYFSEQVLKGGSYEFTIPFNRQQLADYLGVDRSAMSNELSKMRREGILSYDKNAFFLKQTICFKG